MVQAVRDEDRIYEFYQEYLEKIFSVESDLSSQDKIIKKTSTIFIDPLIEEKCVV